MFGQVSIRHGFGEITVAGYVAVVKGPDDQGDWTFRLHQGW